MAEIDIRVVEGPGPPKPIEGAHVRVESACDGQFLETTTDSAGMAHVSMDRAAGRWDLTVAKAAYGATSIVGASEIEIAGPIRLDLLDLTTNVRSVPISGTCAGATGTVIVDGYDMYTTTCSAGAWATTYLFAPWNHDVPLRIAALDHEGLEPRNIAIVEMPRTGEPISDVALTFPDRAPMRVNTPVVVLLDPAGMVNAPDRVFNDEGNAAVVDSSSGAALLSGFTRTTTSDGMVRIEVRQFAPPFQSDTATAIVGQNSTMSRLVICPLLSATEPIRVGGGFFHLEGDNLGNLRVVSEGVVGHDVVEIQITPDLLVPPVSNWRVFAPTLPATFGVPHLPSAVTVDDIGLGPEIGTPIAFVHAGQMAAGEPWSGASIGGVRPGTHLYSVGQDAIYIEPSGR